MSSIYAGHATRAHERANSMRIVVAISFAQALRCLGTNQANRLRPQISSPFPPLPPVQISMKIEQEQTEITEGTESKCLFQGKPLSQFQQRATFRCDGDLQNA